MLALIRGSKGQGHLDHIFCYLARCFGRNSETLESEVESCESKSSSELEREARVKHWVDESNRMYPYFINLDEDSKPKKCVKPDAHGYDVKGTKKPRIPVSTDVRRRQTGPTGAETGSSSLEKLFEAVPALGASFGVSRLVARRNDDSPLPAVMMTPSAATGVARQFAQQLLPLTNAVHSWFNPAICAQKRN